MICRLKTVLRIDSGVSLLEMSVSMLGLAFVSAIMLSWFVGATRVDELHRNDDVAIQELRVSRELITKDIRRARSVTAANDDAVSLWLDGDHDDIQDVGEVVTWTVTGGGHLVRSDDGGGSTTHATGLIVDTSGFAYDDIGAASVTAVELTLTAQVDGGGQRSLTSEISMRNT